MSEVLNAYDKALHDQIHAKMLMMDPEVLLNNPRLKVLDILADFDINGRVADIGCGSGYFGIAVAQRFDSVEKVDCIEASHFAVENVIPRNIEHYNLSSKVKAVEGSFDSLPPETYDVIFAMGALHHSKNLGDTMRSIFEALKPGGLLIAQEPAMPDETTHDAYFNKYNIVEERFGLHIRNGDRFDRFFRECEYKYFLVVNGFDICFWEDFEVGEKNKTGLNNLKMTNNLDSLINPSWTTLMRAATMNLRRKLFVAKKSECSETYHDDSKKVDSSNITTSTEVIRKFRDLGHSVVPSFCKPGELRELNSEFNRAFNGTDAYKIRRAENIIELTEKQVADIPILSTIHRKLEAYFVDSLNISAVSLAKVWFVKTQPKHTQADKLPYLPHFDKHRYLKGMVYLHDVEKGHGPIQFGRVIEPVKIEIRRRSLPQNYKELGLNTIKISELETDMEAILGKAGDVILFDTNAVHCAGIVSEGFQRNVIRFDFDVLGYN
jgi:SAM-dependent methyltransferase